MDQPAPRCCLVPWLAPVIHPRVPHHPTYRSGVCSSPLPLLHAFLSVGGLLFSLDFPTPYSVMFLSTQSNVKLQMYSFAYLSASSATPGGTLYADGDVSAGGSRGS